MPMRDEGSLGLLSSARGGACNHQSVIINQSVINQYQTRRYGRYARSSVEMRERDSKKDAPSSRDRRHRRYDTSDHIHVESRSELPGTGRSGERGTIRPRINQSTTLHQTPNLSPARPRWRAGSENLHVAVDADSTY